MSERPAEYEAGLLDGPIERANEALDWIEQRDGSLPADGYARIETTVGVVRALRRRQGEQA